MNRDLLPRVGNSSTMLYTINYWGSDCSDRVWILHSIRVHSLPDPSFSVHVLMLFSFLQHPSQVSWQVIREVTDLGKCYIQSLVALKEEKKESTQRHRHRSKVIWQWRPRMALCGHSLCRAVREARCTCPPELPGATDSVLVLLSGFWSSKLWENEILLFQSPVL